jgi:hypothetical protein
MNIKTSNSRVTTHYGEAGGGESYAGIYPFEVSERRSASNGDPQMVPDLHSCSGIYLHGALGHRSSIRLGRSGLTKSLEVNKSASAFLSYHRRGGSELLISGLQRKPIGAR